MAIPLTSSRHSRCSGGGTGGYGHETPGTQPVAADQHPALQDQEFEGAAATADRSRPACRYFQEECLLSRCGIAGQQAPFAAVQLPRLGDGRRRDVVDPEELRDVAVGARGHRLGVC